MTASQRVELRQDHRPLLAAMVTQATAAGYLCFLRVKAAVELLPGQKYVAPYQQIMATVDWAGAAAGLTALLAAGVMPPPRWIDGVVAHVGRHATLVAAATAAVLAAFSLTVQQGYPLTMDEYAPVFQAQVFASGRLTSQWPPPLAPLLLAPESRNYFLDVSHVTGQGCSEYWPGHAALLAPFARCGIEWAFNPLLSGIGVVLLAGLARRAFGERAAGWAVVLTLASPVFVAYGISFYAMPAHFVANLVYASLLATPTLPRVAAAGLVGGLALALHNPLPHFAFSLPWLAWLACRGDRWTRLPAIVICYAVVFLPIDVGWRQVEQSIKADRPLGEADRPLGEAAVAAAAPDGDAAATGLWNGWADAASHIRGYFSVLKLPTPREFLERRAGALMRLVAWDAPGLLVFACLGAWHRRNVVLARLFALSGLSTFFLYGLVDSSGGHGWGYRYFFQAWSCLPLLASSLAEERVAPRSAGESMPPVSATGFEASLRRLGVAALASLAICLPVRLWQIHGFITEHRAKLPPLPDVTDAAGADVVRFLEVRGGWFRHDLVRNDPFLRRGPYTLVSGGFETDAAVVAQLGAAMQARPRLIFRSPIGSTWVLDSRPGARDSRPE